MNKQNKVLALQKGVTHKGRVQRLFGVYIPTKPIPSPKRYLTMRFCITGIIPSKKNDFYSENNYRMIAGKAFASANPRQYLKDNIKSWIRGSERYVKWCEEISESIHSQSEFWKNKYDVLFPLANVMIKTTYYFADNTKLDLVNKDESIYDMLVKKGIIVDDDYGTMHKTSSEGYNCKGEIRENICVIDITLMVF